MSGINFLFWNVNRKPLEERIRRIVRSNSVDLVILAECTIPSENLTKAMSAAETGAFYLVPGSADELRLYTRLPIEGWAPIYREPLDAWLGFRIVAPPIPELLLFATHLPSKLHTDEQDRLLDASLLGEDIRRFEEQEKHNRTLLVGDMNGNPFEAPIVWAGGIHGVMTRDVARREVRVVRGREYPVLYNPMWGLLGDRTSGPPGTYYRSSSQTVNYFWNTFDQVLLRPAIMDRLSELKILESDGEESLLTPNGLPDAVNGSDHLPLFFRLEW